MYILLVIDSRISWAGGCSFFVFNLCVPDTVFIVHLVKEHNQTNK